MVCLKWLHKLLSPNKTAFSSKTLICKSDSSSAKYLTVVPLSKIAPQPYLHAFVFNKKLQFGICIGLNESSVLFIHYKISISPACKSSISLSEFPLENLSARIVSLSNDLKCNRPKLTAVKLVVNLPSSIAIFLMIEILPEALCDIKKQDVSKNLPPCILMAIENSLKMRKRAECF